MVKAVSGRVAVRVCLFVIYAYSLVGEVNKDIGSLFGRWEGMVGIIILNY